eukprot:1687979-Ditylum_brightwellii.AAC.1
MDTYRKVSQYNRLLEMVVISDYSGTEKKALVLHAQKLVTDMGASFAIRLLKEMQKRFTESRVQSKKNLALQVTSLQIFALAVDIPIQPLVLFKDDLQWADPMSPEVINSSATDIESKSLLFLGSRRYNELDNMHPLAGKLH